MFVENNKIFLIDNNAGVGSAFSGNNKTLWEAKQLVILLMLWWWRENDNAPGGCGNEIMEEMTGASENNRVSKQDGEKE